jgi:hypothetical protein
MKALLHATAVTIITEDIRRRNKGFVHPGHYPATAVRLESEETHFRCDTGSADLVSSPFSAFWFTCKKQGCQDARCALHMPVYCKKICCLQSELVHAAHHLVVVNIQISTPQCSHEKLKQAKRK